MTVEWSHTASTSRSRSSSSSSNAVSFHADLERFEVCDVTQGRTEGAPVVSGTGRWIARR